MCGEGIAITAGFDVGAAQELGRLGTKVIGAVMVDRQDFEAGVVIDVRRMLGQGDDGALGQLTHGAVAGETTIVRFDGSHRQVGAQLGAGGNEGLVVLVGQRDGIG